MALNPKFATATASAEADALARLVDNGYLRIYSGTQPATANTALSGNTLLAEARFNATSAPAASNGLLTFSAFTADSSIDATGTAAFFRALSSNGTSVVYDGTVGTATSDLVVNSVAFSAGAQFSVTSFTLQISLG